MTMMVNNIAARAVETRKNLCCLEYESVSITDSINFMSNLNCFKLGKFPGLVSKWISYALKEKSKISELRWENKF